MNAHSLEELHDLLDALTDELDDGTVVPERYQTTAKAHLAESDARRLKEASTIIHRLMLWHKYPAASPESYVVTMPRAVA